MSNVSRTFGSRPHVVRHLNKRLMMKSTVLNLHMPNGAIHYKLYFIKLRMAVEIFLSRIIKGAF